MRIDIRVELLEKMSKILQSSGVERETSLAPDIDSKVVISCEGKLT